MEDTSLRRRDRIKSSERYSPPPHKPNKRGGKTPSGGRSVGRPSSVGSRLAPSTSRLARSSGRDVKSVDVDVKKDVDGKTLISLPDGTTYRVDATHVSISSSKEAAADADPDFDPADAGEFEGEDDSYEPSYGARKRMQDPSVGRSLSGKRMKQAPSSGKNSPPKSATRVLKTPSSTDEDKTTPAPTQRSYTRRTPVRNTEPSIVGITAGRERGVGITAGRERGVGITAGRERGVGITAGREGSIKEGSIVGISAGKEGSIIGGKEGSIIGISGGKRPLVQSYSRKSFNVNRSIAAGGINAKDVTITQAHFKHPPKRSYGISAKFIDDLPELFDCTG